jgi:hypothetical protein
VPDVWGVMVRSAWLKVRYEDQTTGVAGVLIHTKRFSWALLRSTKFNSTDRYPSGIDVAAVEWLRDFAPEVAFFIVHLKGTGRVYRISMAALVNAVADKKHLRKYETEGGSPRRRVYIDTKLWTLDRVSEPFVLPDTPFSQDILVADKLIRKEKTS